MPMNLEAVGAVSKPGRNSWASKDALLYALGVGAGQMDPTGFELEFTTENSQNIEQRVLPTMPVVLGIPHDLQQQSIEQDGEYRPSDAMLPTTEGIRPSARLVTEAAQRIRAAKRPIIIAGRGAVAAEVGALLEQLAAQCGALLSTTLPAKGLFDRNEFSIGIAGGFCSELAYELFSGCDLVIAVGASLSQHTMHGGKLFPKAFVVHIDLDPLGLQYGVGTADLSLQCDARAGIEALIEELRKQGSPTDGFHSTALARRIATEKHDPREYPIEPGTFDPRDVIAELDRVIPKDWDVLSGGGHASYFTTLMRGRSPRNYFTLREFGAVGNGLSFALGVAAVRPEGKVLLLEGDGGLMMHVQEQETVKRHKLKLVIGIMNDGGFGAEIHKFRADGIDPAEAIFGRPDFAAIAREPRSVRTAAARLRGRRRGGSLEHPDLRPRAIALHIAGGTGQALDSPSLPLPRTCGRGREGAPLSAD